MPIFQVVDALIFQIQRQMPIILKIACGHSVLVATKTHRPYFNSDNVSAVKSSIFTGALDQFKFPLIVVVDECSLAIF